jgi:hypothetical protein
MKRYAVPVVAVVCVALVGCFVWLVGQASFEPEFLAESKMQLVSQNIGDHSDTWIMRTYAGQVPFDLVEPLAIKEMRARGYETEVTTETRTWFRAKQTKGTLIKDHRYLPGGRLVVAPGWTSFWYAEQTSLTGKLAESLGISN